MCVVLQSHYRDIATTSGRPDALIIIIINDNVYGTVIVTMATARVHPVHLMNAD